MFSPLIKLITYLLVLTLVLIFREYGYRHSTAIPVQWLTSLFIASIELYRIFITDSDVFSAILIGLEVGFVFMALFISCLTPTVTSFESLDSDNEPKCPMTEFNVFSRVLYLLITRLLKYGYKANSDLKHHLLPICWYQKSKSSSDAYELADKKYNSDKPLARMRLFALIWSTTWAPYLSGSLLVFGEIGTDFIQPFFLSKLMDFVSGADDYRWHGYYYAIAYCMLNVFSRLIDCHKYMYFLLVQYRVRTALTTAVFKKMLKLSPDSRREYTTGLYNNCDFHCFYGFPSL